MPGSRLGFAAIWVTSLLVAGCATVEPQKGFSDVEGMARDRLGSELVWPLDDEPDAAIDARVAELLATTLSPEAAVQIGLLKNPELQALYEAIGIANADLVQAGLIQNPVLVVTPRFGVGSVTGTNLEMDIAQNLLQLLTLRARKKLATTQFEEARLRVSHDVVRVAADIRVSFYEAVGAKHLVAVMREVEESAAVSSEYAARLHAAGNISDLARARARSLHEETRLARATAEADAVGPLAQLTRLLGLDALEDIELPETLPGLPPGRIITDDLETRALGSRLDLQALDRDVDAFAQALSLARFYQWIPFLEVGVSAQRELDGAWVVGPALALEIPIFDQGQAQVARFEALVRERKRSRDALALDVRRDIRIRSARLLIQGSVAERMIRTLIPLRERIVELTQEQYNFMLLGAFELLDAKRDEIMSYRNYVTALRDYWVGWALLGEALGGVAPEMESAEPARVEATDPEMDAMKAMDGMSMPSTDPDSAHRNHEQGGHDGQ